MRGLKQSSDLILSTIILAYVSIMPSFASNLSQELSQEEREARIDKMIAEFKEINFDGLDNLNKATPVSSPPATPEQKPNQNCASSFSPQIDIIWDYFSKKTLGNKSNEDDSDESDDESKGILSPDSGYYKFKNFCKALREGEEKFYHSTGSGLSFWVKKVGKEIYSRSDTTEPWRDKNSDPVDK
ncbi:hypothetical protein [Candidatus Nucleicultrix amoebiphila]|jgi:hypothetical protein|uniref:Uncharacterized protein n=1 Tax=Candidatus Nucleicultrix amoebiphila FS5 TaxID=1414854 RepID=A0A1W6N3H0_9PROT|nr:hypothetical protein [Candidatus Nucleicultrix amoebiphila]ARN84363.1 hypothetical protein GQ61_02375 [Candidatus Nucleicultrix amoebiphila FS5]